MEPERKCRKRKASPIREQYFSKREPLINIRLIKPQTSDIDETEPEMEFKPIVVSCDFPQYAMGNNEMVKNINREANSCYNLQNSTVLSKNPSHRWSGS